MIYIVMHKVKPMKEANSPAVALVACGSAGIALCSGLSKERYGIAAIIAIDTSEKALKACRNADRTIRIRHPADERPLSPARLREIAQAYQTAIKQALSGMQAVVIVAGAAGVAGGTLAPLVAEYANRHEKLVLTVLSWPFAFEERQARRRAMVALGRQIAHANSVLTLHEPALEGEESLSALIAERQTALQHYLWHVCGCLFRPKLTEIDFDEIRDVFALVSGCHISHLGWGEASGAMRATLAVEQALSHAGLPSSQLRTSHSLSVDIRANRGSLSMLEVTQVLDRIQRELGRTTPPVLVFSAGYDDGLGDRLQVSLIVN